MNPSGSGFPTGDGIITQNYGRMDFKTWLGVTDGKGGNTAWYTHRTETITRNFTAPEFLNDMFGGIETTIEDNFTYRGTLDLKLWKATFKTNEQNNNLVYPTMFESTIALKNDWIQTGYLIDTMMYKTTNEWSSLIEEYENSMVVNKKMYEVNKTLNMIVQTALATGNFKVIEGLTSTDGAPTPEQQYSYQKFQNAVIAYKMKWTTQSKGLMNTFQILFAPYAFQGALQAMGQTSITASQSAYDAYERGSVLKWYGFNIREFIWLENNYLFNVEMGDPKTSQRLQPNATGEDFDFTKVSAVLFTPDTVIRKCKQPFFVFDSYSPNGFVPAAWFGGANVVDLARIFNFTIDAFVKPFNEGKNLVVFKETPSVDDCLNARKYLAGLYPTLYRGITAENGYIPGDSDGTQTKTIINQWREAAGKYKYSQDSLPQDSNIYGLKGNWVNFNGITKEAATKQKSK